jgi:acetate kinase
MKILVINCGSSSLKYQLFDMGKESVLAKGIVERIGMDTAIFQYERPENETIKEVASILEHKDALRKVLKMITDENRGVITSVHEIAAVGHRIAHGGEEFADSVVVTNHVIEAIRKNIELAPLHNPANLKGIYAFLELAEDIPMVCVFDTAFHQTMPPEHFMYAIPRALYNKHKIRRYGFHGTSHKYVSQRYSELTGKDLQSTKIISCHIGNGASISAIEFGKSVDTSMGMTPLEGLIMGTRSGDIDPAIVPFVMVKEDLNVNEVNSMLNKHSGLVGVSGISADMREITDGVNAGHEGATLAYKMYIHRIKKYIGSYCAVMNGVDAIIFTGGVGENSHMVRSDICEGLTFLGLELDDQLNDTREPKERSIQVASSLVDVYIIPTNEELMIARDTLRLVKSNKAVTPLI